MNVISYVEKYRDLSFIEKPFSNVDAVMFACLSYLHFDLISPSITEPKKAPTVLNALTEEEIVKIVADIRIKDNVTKLLKQIVGSKRYEGVTVQYIFNVLDDMFLEQFFGVTFYIPTIGYYIVYRGTDSTSIGWKENFYLSIQKATASQLDAREYLKIVYSYIGDTPFMIGGHSKGGNLAYYAAFKAPLNISKNIIHAYSFDGTGFYTKEYKKYESYQSLYSKLVQIVPGDSFVGELFYTPNNQIIVKSDGKKLSQHNMYNWHVTEEGDFEYIQKRTFVSRVRHRAIKKWAHNGKTEDKLLLMNLLIKVFATKSSKASKMPITKRISLGLKEFNKEEQRKMKKFLNQLIFRYIFSFIYYIVRPFRSGKKDNNIE